MAGISTIGFDADDTLWQNETFFRLTEQRFTELLSEHGAHEVISARLLEAERRNLRFYGFGVKGFTLSMIETAVEVTNGQVSASVIGEILGYGRQMLQNPVETLPHARETLDALAGRYRILLITKGDLFDQERKLAQSGLSDPQVLGAMGQIPRHQFVDSALATQAYEDTSLPIGLGQTISKPSVVARMIELLRQGALMQADGRMGRVLEIGTGCGYQAAVLSCVAKEVYSIERLRGLHDKARDNLRPLRLPNLHLLFGDGMLGYPKGAPYAAIIAAAGGEAVPSAWMDQLAVGGRVIAPTLMANGQQALVVIDKTPQGLKQQQFEAVHFVPLKSGIA